MKVYNSVGVIGGDKRQLYCAKAFLNDGLKVTLGGFDKLKSEACMTDSLEAEIEPTSNYAYPDDYDLGDIVTISIPSWGISVNRRITEINEVYENGGYKIEPIFGTRATISFSDN